MASRQPGSFAELAQRWMAQAFPDWPDAEINACVDQAVDVVRSNGRPDLGVREPQRRKVSPQVRPGWFAARIPPAVPGVLLAADDDAVVLRTETPDGSIRMVVRRRREPAGGFDAELILGREVDLPAVAVVHYHSHQDGPVQLLVPITDAHVGPPTSTVFLNDLDAATSVEYGLTGIGDIVDDDMVTRSIAAAVSVSTIRAWSAVAAVAEPDLGRTIHRRLEDR